MKRLRNLLIAGVIVVVSIIGLSFDSNDKDFNLAKNLDVFYTLFREVSTFYVDETDASELIETGINAMLKKLDPYTVYVPESDLDDLKFMTTGQYGGIGALIRKHDGKMLIYEPYESFPASKYGLIAGDEILEIDGVDNIGSKSINEISDLLKGQPKTTLKIKVKRPFTDEVISKDIVREKIIIPNVPYYTNLENNIGYIRLSGFTSDAALEVKKAFIELKHNGAKSLILDLRSNPGGILQEAVDIVNLFVPKGKVIVETKGRAKKWDKTYSTRYDPIDTEIPISVLVNSSSASASEIVAGALQDLDRGVVVGQKTFGKGLVQSTRQLSYNSMLKITTAKYYIPSGRCVQALDYSHRKDDGSVGNVPDSLKSEFLTSNGRKVFDGGGVEPDIKTKSHEFSKISIDLILNERIFEYATKYYTSHTSIPSAETFKISDADYEDFKAYLKSVNFKHKTDTEKSLELLVKTAKEEAYFDRIKDKVESLKLAVKSSHEDDITFHKDEIRKLINMEIASRYFLKKGKIQNGIHSNDVEIEKAKNVLLKKTKYNSILAINK